MVRCPSCNGDFEPPPGGDIPDRCPACGVLVLIPYCDLQWVGGGGMGDVYRAREPTMGDRCVAIKIPRSQTNVETLSQRFEREIAASARLQHENAVRVYGRGQERGRPFLVMEFVSGRKLSDVIRTEHPLACRRVARILLGIARGLEHGEARGVINRDIKPENIFLTTPDETPKILDYGLALLPHVDQQVTRYGAILGTPSYTAPEQFRDPHSVTIAADVYSLGCLAYSCLARKRPFEGQKPDEIWQQHCEAPRPSVRAVRPDVPEPLDQIIRGMMASDSQCRPTPQQIVEALETLMPQLDERPPLLSAVADTIRVTVCCPDCGEEYHLALTMAGKRMRCTNKLCCKVFEVPQAGEPIDPLKGSPFEPHQGLADLAQRGPPAPTADQPVNMELVAWLPAESASDGGSPQEPLVLGEPVEGEPLPDAAIGHRSVAARDTPGNASGAASTEIGGLDVVRPSAVGATIPPGLAGSEIVAGIPVSSTPHEATPPPPFARSCAGEFDSTVAFTPHTAPTEAAMGEPIQGQPIPGEPVDVAGSSAQESAASVFAYSPVARKRRKPPLAKILVAAAGAVALILIAVWVYREVTKPPPDPWGDIAQHVTRHEWDQARRKLDKFADQYPDDPHVDQAPFFKDLCEAGPEIYGTTGDPARGLEILQGLFRDHRDNPAYKEYCGELYKGLAELIGHFVDRAEDVAKNRKIEEARKAYDVLKKGREAHELYSTVGAAMSAEGMGQALSPEQAAKVGHTPPEAGLLLDKTERSIDSRIAGLELQVLKAKAADPRQSVDPDALYRDIRKQFAIWRGKADAALDRDDEYQKLVESLRLSECVRVRFDRDDPAAAVAPPRVADDAGRQGNTLVVAWSKAGEPAAPSSNPDDAVLALARGILYVFDRHGQLKWSRRLGVDSFRLPHLVRGGQWQTPALIGVSSEDQSLLALEAGASDAGRVRWRYGVGQDITAPMTVARLREDPNHPYRDFGFLPTAAGEVHVLELFRGRRVGRFFVGQPLTVGGVHWRPEKFGPDEPGRANGLVFFPADRQRIFALNPSVVFAKSGLPGEARSDRDQTGQSSPTAACRYILFTRHPSGSLRGEPMAVGQYLVLSETTGLEHTSLRVFQVGDRESRDLTAATKHHPRLRGWAWFPPHGTPDRVSLVTDAGDLGVFGFNLDNPSENIYYVVEQDNQAAPELAFQDASRTLVVHGEEHLLWIMAGGRLQLYAIDVIRQRVHSVWKQRKDQATVSGIPVHEAQVDRGSGTIYLTTMSPGGMTYHFWAVDAMTGRLRWDRQLGMSIQGDPLVWKNNVLLVDRGGQRLALRPSAEPVFYDRPRMVQLAAVDPLPEGMDENRMLRLGEPPGPVYLVASDASGSRLAIRAVHPPKNETEDWSTQPWTVLPLPARETLCGRPCVLGDALVVPCLYSVQGQVSLKTFPLGAAAQSGDARQYTWTPAYPPPMNSVDVYPLGPGAVLVVEGRRILTRLELRTANGVTQWDRGVTDRDPDGRVYHLRDPLAERPLVRGGDILAFDTQGKCYRLDVNNPRRELASPSPTGVRLARMPLVRGDFLLAIDGDNGIAAFPAGQGSLADKPAWTSRDPGRRRIAGEPALAGDTLLVADNSCHVSGVRLQDGKTLWKIPFSVRVGPAAAAVPYGPGSMLIPLADGTFLVLPIPKTPPAEATK